MPSNTWMRSRLPSTTLADDADGVAGGELGEVGPDLFLGDLVEHVHGAFLLSCHGQRALRGGHGETAAVAAEGGV